MIITVIRTALLYLLVVLALRLMGKRQIGDMQPNELVITIFISQLASMPIEDQDRPILGGIIAILLLIVLEIVISFITMKSTTLRGFINGKSAPIIKDGVLDQRLIKKLRLTVTDIMEMLRQQQVFNIEQVSWAILETNGTLSVLLKPEYRPATANDVKAAVTDDGLPSPVICDGVVIDDSLEQIGLDKNGLRKMLTDRRLSVKQVLLMVVDKSKNAVLIKKESDL